MHLKSRLIKWGGFDGSGLIKGDNCICLFYFNSYTGEDSVRVVLRLNMAVTFNLTNTNTQNYKMLFNETSSVVSSYTFN
jgi:hypothetical protein